MLPTFKRNILFLILFFLIIPAFAQTVPVLTGNALSGPDLKVYFLDVGQGNCQLIKLSNGKFMLYDCGSTSSSVNPATIAAKITAITGGKDITTIFLSHPDADHINIIPYINEAKKPLFVHYSSNLADYNAILGAWISKLPTTTKKVHYVSDYFSVTPLTDIDGDPNIKIYMLAANVTGDANTKSLVISIDFDMTNVLLTGDATATTERAILKNVPTAAIRATLLAFGHHGSNHSSSQNFLKAVNPDIGIFSASANHLGYGHPRCILLDYVEKMVDVSGKNGITIPMHQIDCWDPAKGKYVIENNDLGVFLTYTQGNIVYSSDGTYYSVYADKLK